MFGFGWVRIHLGVVFGDAFGYLRLFGWVFKKMDKMIKKIWAMSGALRRGVGTPRRSRGMSTPRSG